MNIDLEFEEKEKVKDKANKNKIRDEDEDKLFEDDFDDEDDGDDEDSLDTDSDSGDFEEKSPPIKKYIIIGGIALVVIGVVLFLIFGEKKEPEVTPPPEQEAQVDPLTELQDSLYKKGIGKEAVDEKNIYDQGPLSGKDFRKDFTNIDSPETYELPIKIAAVNDSVSYTKHRTMTDDGMDMYWVDAMYKSKKTRFTLPYYIWQTLSPQGVMDVIVETVVDKGGKTFVTSITAVPPNTQEGDEEE